MKDITNILYRRQYVTKEAVDRIALSMKVGQVQPVVLVENPAPAKGYELIEGTLRLAAAQQNGDREIEAKIYKTLPRVEKLRILWAGNEREPINELDRAAQLNLWVQEGFSQSDIATKIGVTQQSVSYYLSLLTLPKSVKEAVGKGEIAAAAAKEVIRLPSAAEQRKALKDLKGSSVRLVKAAVKDRLHEIETTDRAVLVAAQIAEIEGKLEEIKKAEAEKAALTQEAEKLQDKIKKLEKETPREINGLITKLQVIEKDILPTRARAAKMQAEIKALQETVKGWDDKAVKKEMDSLEAGFKAKSQAVKDLQAQLSQARAERDAFGEQFQKLLARSKDIARAQQEIKSTQKDLAETQKYLDKNEKLYETELKDVDKLKATVEASDKERLTKRLDLVRQLGQVAQKIPSLTAKINQKNGHAARLKELKGELAELKAHVAESGTAAPA